jgi:hypothetical protein
MVASKVLVVGHVDRRHDPGEGHKVVLVCRDGAGECRPLRANQPSKRGELEGQTKGVAELVVIERDLDEVVQILNVLRELACSWPSGYLTWGQKTVCVYVCVRACVLCERRVWLGVGTNRGGDWRTGRAW